MTSDQNSPVHWNLRALMADAGMFQTTDLIQPLRDHGVTLSREQVFRLVTRTPERLNIEVLAALCRIFDCGPSELITVKPPQQAAEANPASRGRRDTPIGDLRPVREVSASIITRPARDASGEIHDRMPVFLESTVWDEYLAPDKLDDAGKQDMIQLLTVESDRVAGTITSYDVDRKVNNTRTADPTDPTLIEPVDVAPE